MRKLTEAAPILTSRITLVVSKSRIVATLVVPISATAAKVIALKKTIEIQWNCNHL